MPQKSPNILRSPHITYALLTLAALATWAVIIAVLTAQPAATLEQTTGLYEAQGDATPYRWTSNRVQIPIHGQSGPTVVELAFGPARWDGRQLPTITLVADQRILTAFSAPDQLRHYRVVLGPATATLMVQAPVERPPGNDPRWLGVTLYALTATASGLPIQAASQAILPALAILLAALALAWSARRGYAIVAALTLLALVLRVVLLRVTPPGFRPDEVVSLVDAWNIARTAHDHLGHLLPLGAQEAFGDWISPLLTYIELPAVAIFGPNVLVGRLVTALFGTLAAPLCYLLARQLQLPTLAAACAGLAAALSPWQIFMSRMALPPTLVPLGWGLCLWAGLRLIQRGERRDALALALAAGVALYAYPTLKLGVPLLAALAVALALPRYGWGALWRWLPAALLVALLWLPFVYVTLFNPASSTRLDQTMIQADSWRAWLIAWFNGYSVYFQPDFYYSSGDGSSIRGVPGHGAELLATAPLVVIGLLALIWRTFTGNKRLEIRNRRAPNPQSPISNLQSPISNLQSPIPNLQSPISNLQPSQWWFLLGAILLAPLPASLTQPSPHYYRAATIAPLYALLVGLGVAAILSVLARIARPQLRRAVQAVGIALFAATLAWQAGDWFRDYTQDYPPRQARDNQDGLIDAMTRAIGYAPDFDEVWISYENINEPYIYLLAAQPMPPAQSQAQTAITRTPGHFNDITSIGNYRFVSVADIPIQLPVLEAIPDQFGGRAFLLQQWQHAGKKILILRRMD